ncbi:hypothetical protein Scep_022998 [Stephania cephalantha]|uniref:Thioredoxin domain-containing protein n=1 Tax=Stephania cephalantha TaxID=152367 RepID=A0AAP0I316_9MAGN
MGLRWMRKLRKAGIKDEEFSIYSLGRSLHLLCHWQPLSTLIQDCVRAEPVIYKKLEASSADVALLRAYIGADQHGGTPATHGGLIPFLNSQESCALGK